MLPSFKLYRPVGQKELELIRKAAFKAFPPRLPEQPFFYPVLNKEYAVQIARDWNTKDPNSGYQGYVLEFVIDSSFFVKHKLEPKIVGAKNHQEYWVPSDLLPELNNHLIRTISIIEKFV